MKGLELCKSYYENIGKPELFRIFPEVMGRAAAGLSGQGSDCLGLDDEFSRDHDFGPGFILWLTDADYEKFGAALQAAYDELPKQYLGFERRPPHTGAQRVGVMRTSDFYRYYIGCPGVPDSLMRWVRIQEHFLATCTSGEVFEDGLGEFSAVRNGLLPCYPEDVRLKKLAARAGRRGDARLAGTLAEDAERLENGAELRAADRYAGLVYSLRACALDYAPEGALVVLDQPGRFMDSAPP